MRTCGFFWYFIFIHFLFVLFFFKFLIHLQQEALQQALQPNSSKNLKTKQSLKFSSLLKKRLDKGREKEKEKEKEKMKEKEKEKEQEQEQEQEKEHEQENYSFVFLTTIIGGETMGSSHRSSDR